jgi:uncharacterized repeat protein (TIGR03987 family)
MKMFSMIGSMVVTLALIFYSTGFFKERRKKLVTSNILLFFTVGVILDITATILMILGSSKGMLTIHGFIGYSSLLGMSVDTFHLWKYYFKYGNGKEVTNQLHLYSCVAYSWWVIAYITGGVLVALRNL